MCSARRIRLAAMFLLLVLGACSAPPDPNSQLPDAAKDGFLDVVPPAGVAFDEFSNISLRLISEIDTADIIRVARAQNVPEEYINMLPLVSIMATADLTLRYAGGKTGTFTESVEIGAFERSFEFACPDAVDVAVRVDAQFPLGQQQPLFSGAPFTLRAGEDFECGDTIARRVYVDDGANVHFEAITP